MKTKHQPQPHICGGCGATLKPKRFIFSSNLMSACDPTCRRAVAAGRTRGEQQDHELMRENQHWGDADEHPLNPFRSSSGNLELENRPYLAVA